MEERCTSLETSSPLECEVVKCCISGVTSASDTIYDYLQRDKQLAPTGTSENYQSNRVGHHR